MKRCPYCAEDIQDEAVICRYCSKRVKFDFYRAFIIAFVILSAIIFLKMHERRVSKVAADVKIFVMDISSSLREFYGAVKEFPANLRALVSYKKKLESIDSIINFDTDVDKASGIDEPEGAEAH